MDKLVKKLFFQCLPFNIVMIEDFLWMLHNIRLKSDMLFRFDYLFQGWMTWTPDCHRLLIVE